MRLNAKRVAELEKRPGSITYHVIDCPVGEKRDAAIDAYGRHKIGARDLAIIVPFARTGLDR